ncbi:hypothetical protein M422DRAFT_176749, partial [Sphaerobolus stellatus SS14]
MLSQSLKKLPGLSSQEVDILIDPADHQNVPKVVKLLNRISDISTLPLVSLNPAQVKAHNAIVLLGAILKALIQLFTDLTMTLTHQLKSLSMTSHLCLAQMFMHGTAFISGQLYHDVQAMIKNVFFCVAKQCLLNPLSGFYLCQVGDDRLENVFGTVCTLTHDRNVDALQLSDHLAAAGEITSILSEHPEWDRGHRRLKLEGADGVDHVNPASWKGDVITGNVSIQHCWDKGR